MTLSDDTQQWERARQLAGERHPYPRISRTLAAIGGFCITYFGLHLFLALADIPLEQAAWPFLLFVLLGAALPALWVDRAQRAHFAAAEHLLTEFRRGGSM